MTHLLSPATVFTEPGRTVHRPSWVALRADPASVAGARRFAAEVAGVHVPDLEYLYVIRLVVSELVTNAIRATTALRSWQPEACPLRLDVAACARWTHVAVTDPDHRPLPASDQGGTLIGTGRGLGIVGTLTDAWWVIYAEHVKTIHALIAAPGVDLPPAELHTLRGRR